MRSFKIGLSLSLLCGLLYLLFLFGQYDPGARYTRAPKEALSVEESSSVAPQELPEEEEVAWPEDAPRGVYGQVLDLDGAPIMGAKLSILYPNAKERSAQSSAKGDFRLDHLAPGFQEVQIEARGYLPQLHQELPFPARARLRWDFYLELKSGITGIVLGDQGAASEARVFLRRVGHQQPLGFSRADATGRFALEWPEEGGALELWAHHGQSGETSLQIEEPGEYQLRLPGGGFLSGSVIDEQGDPVISFSITASPLLSGGGPPAQSFEDELGRFQLGPLAPGRVRLWVAAEGYQPTDLHDILLASGEETSEILLRMKRSLTLQGRVSDAHTGRAIEGAQIIPAEWRAQALAESVGAYSDEQGRYHLSALPGDRSSLRVEAEGYQSLLLGGVQGKPGASLRRDFSLEPLQAGQRGGAQLTGIGAVLLSHREGVSIQKVVSGGPAEGRLQRGDLILQVGLRSAKKLGLQRVAQAIRGEEGSEVELLVRRRGQREPLSILLTRSRVRMPEVRRRRRSPH